jgi:hypothetical protein
VPSIEEDSSEGGSTPLYRIVEDPRAKRRHLKAVANAADSKADRRHREPVAPTAEIARNGDKFTLPTLQGKMLTVSVPKGAKISDYEWFGIYDQCQQVGGAAFICRSNPIALQIRTAYVSLKEIKPPTEQTIGAIVGVKHNVSSGRIQVLNCNTLLIPQFVLNKSRNTSAFFFLHWDNNTAVIAASYFYVGIGDFPSYIVQQVRVYVVGRPPYAFLSLCSKALGNV